MMGKKYINKLLVVAASAYKALEMFVGVLETLSRQR